MNPYCKSGGERVTINSIVRISPIYHRLVDDIHRWRCKKCDTIVTQKVRRPKGDPR